MSHWLTVAACAAAVVGSASSQKITVFPNDHANVEGGAVTSSNPFSAAVNRQQFIFNKSYLGIPDGANIKQVGFRQNGTSELKAGFRIQIEVFMGTSILDFAKTSTLMTTNYDKDRTNVFSKKIFDLPGFTKPAKAPSTNFAMLTLDRPWKLNASKNLVVEFITYANSNQNNAFAYPVDFARFASTTEIFGKSCKGSNSKELAIASTKTRIGANWTVSLGNALRTTAAALIFSINKDKLGGVIPLPIPLDGIGATGCSLNVDPLLTLPRVTNTQGGTSVAIRIPNLESLYRVKLYGQYIASDPFANNAGLTFSPGAGVDVGMSPRVMQVFNLRDTGNRGSLNGSTNGQMIFGFAHD